MSYFVDNPPLRDHLNVCLAQVSAAVVNTGRPPKTKATSIQKFIIDYRKKEPMSREQIADKVRSFF